MLHAEQHLSRAKREIKKYKHINHSLVKNVNFKIAEFELLTRQEFEASSHSARTMTMPWYNTPQCAKHNARRGTTTTSLRSQIAILRNINVKLVNS